MVGSIGSLKRAVGCVPIGCVGRAVGGRRAMTVGGVASVATRRVMSVWISVAVSARL